MSPQLRRLVDLPESDVRALIKDIGGSGTYRASDLHTWYLAMMTELGFQGVGPIKFGTTLKALGFRRTIKRFEGKNTRCWTIPRSWDRAPDA